MSYGSLWWGDDWSMKESLKKAERKAALAHAAGLPQGFELRRLKCAWCENTVTITSETPVDVVSAWITAHKKCEPKKAPEGWAP